MAEISLGEYARMDREAEVAAEARQMSDTAIVATILGYRQEAEDARRVRDALTERNMAAYFSRIGGEEPMAGQSDEFLPKVALGVDRTAAVINRGLTGYGQWFAVELAGEQGRTTGQRDTSRLTAEQIEKLMRRHLEPQQSALGDVQNFPLTVTDASKVGLLQAVCALKIGGDRLATKQLALTDLPAWDTAGVPTGMHEQLLLIETPRWQLRTSLVRPRDLYLDPSGKGLYIIEASEIDWHELVEQSEGPEPLYDIRELRAAQSRAAGGGPGRLESRDGERDAEVSAETNTPVPPSGAGRRKVQLLECWGTILNEDGEAVYRNVVCTIASEKYVIRRPQQNPFWHQRPPYVICPLLRVPFSVNHKALYDDVVDLNLSLNKMFNLMLDGAIASAWNTRQVHMDRIKNSEDFTAGIPPGSTLIPNDDVPPGTPLMMSVNTGQVPGDAMAMYALVDKEMQSASMDNDIRAGQVPQGRVTATAVSEASTQGSLFFESIIYNLEHNFIQPALWMCWLTILQHADDWMQPETRNLIGEDAARALAGLSPARRYMLYAEDARFRVYGISSVLARTKQYQKLLALLQVINANAPIGQAILQEIDLTKFLHMLFQSLNLDPDALLLSEQQKLERQVQQMEQMHRTLLGGGMPGMPGPGVRSGMTPPQEPGTADLLRDARQARTMPPQSSLS